MFSDKKNIKVDTFNILKLTITLNIKLELQVSLLTNLKIIFWNHYLINKTVSLQMETSSQSVKAQSHQQFTIFTFL